MDSQKKQLVNIIILFFIIYNIVQGIFVASSLFEVVGSF